MGITHGSLYILMAGDFFYRPETDPGHYQMRDSGVAPGVNNGMRQFNRF